MNPSNSKKMSRKMLHKMSQPMLRRMIHKMSPPITNITVTIKTLNGDLLEITYNTSAHEDIYRAIREIDPVAYPSHRLTIFRCDEEDETQVYNMTRNRHGDVLGLFVSEPVVARITRNHRQWNEMVITRNHRRWNEMVNSSDGEYIIQYSSNHHDEAEWDRATRYLFTYERGTFYNCGTTTRLMDYKQFDNITDIVSHQVLRNSYYMTAVELNGHSRDVIAASVIAWEQLSSKF